MTSSSGLYAPSLALKDFALIHYHVILIPFTSSPPSSHEFPNRSKNATKGEGEGWEMRTMADRNSSFLPSAYSQFSRGRDFFSPGFFFFWEISFSMHYLGRGAFLPSEKMYPIVCEHGVQAKIVTHEGWIILSDRTKQNWNMRGIKANNWHCLQCAQHLRSHTKKNQCTS